MKSKFKSAHLGFTLGLATAIGLMSFSTVNSSPIGTPSSNNLIAQSYENDNYAQLTPEEQANANFQDKLSGRELLTALRQGGYIIYFRHAQTEQDYADQVSADVNNCATQRVLNETGWRQARMIGGAFAAHSIPVGQVITSEYCRAWKTADLAFGQYEQNPALNFLPFEDYTPEQVVQMRENVMPLLTALPPSGVNTVIVGHDDIFEAATGIYPDPQGIAYVLKPNRDGSFDLVANLLPEEWLQLD